MSDFNVFEVTAASEDEGRIARQAATDKLAAATYDVRAKHGQWLFGAKDLDAFRDRVSLAHVSICQTIEPHLHARTGVQRKVIKTLEREWRKRQATDDLGMPGILQTQKPEGYDARQALQPLSPTGNAFTEIGLKNGLTPLARRLTAEELDTDVTYSPHTGDTQELDGDFNSYKSRVDQGADGKVSGDFVGEGSRHDEDGGHNFVPTVTGSREFQHISRMILAADPVDPTGGGMMGGQMPAAGEMPEATAVAPPTGAAPSAPMANPTVTASVLRYANWCLATRMRPHSMDTLDRYAANHSDREYFALAAAIEKSAAGASDKQGERHHGSRKTAAPDYLQKADEALTNLLNQKAEEFQQSVQALQQALVTVQQAEAVQQQQNPLGVQPPAGTVNVMPGGGDPGQGDDPSQAMALAGGDPSGGMGGPPQGDPSQQMMAARHLQATDDDNYSSWLSGWADHESDVREREREEAEKKDGKKEAARRRFARLHQAKDCTCWKGYKRVPGTKPCAEGSCEKCDTHKESRRRQAIQTHPNWDAYQRSIEDHQDAQRARNAPPQEPVKFSDEDVAYLKGLGQTPDQAGGGFPDWESYHKHHGASRVAYPREENLTQLKKDHSYAVGNGQHELAEKIKRRMQILQSDQKNASRGRRPLGKVAYHGDDDYSEEFQRHNRDESPWEEVAPGWKQNMGSDAESYHHTSGGSVAPLSSGKGWKATHSNNPDDYSAPLPSKAHAMAVIESGAPATGWTGDKQARVAQTATSTGRAGSRMAGWLDGPPPPAENYSDAYHSYLKSRGVRHDDADAAGSDLWWHTSGDLPKSLRSVKRGYGGPLFDEAVMNRIERGSRGQPFGLKLTKGYLHDPDTENDILDPETGEVAQWAKDNSRRRRESSSRGRRPLA